MKQFLILQEIERHTVCKPRAEQMWSCLSYNCIYSCSSCYFLFLATHGTTVWHITSYCEPRERIIPSLRTMQETYWNLPWTHFKRSLIHATCNIWMQNRLFLQFVTSQTDSLKTHGVRVGGYRTPPVCLLTHFKGWPARMLLLCALRRASGASDKRELCFLVGLNATVRKDVWR
jgi:hypothetical protein